jgi:P-type Mg2+ transporter
MPLRIPSIFPKALLAAMRKPVGQMRASPLLLDACKEDAAAVYARMKTGSDGLSEDAAAERLAQYGPNVVGHELRHPRLRLFGHALANPLVILLAILATLSFLTGDLRAGTVVLLMVALGVILRFVQEARADTAAARLKAMISVTATVIRGGQPREIPVAQIVPGDLVKLAAGDMVPGDVRLITAKDLFIVQGSLTGESFPVEKFDQPESEPHRPAVELRNICFLGTSVESGSATAVVVATGFDTYLGSMADAIVGTQVQTAFDKGVKSFTWLMIRFILVMVPLVFLINGFSKGDPAQAANAHSWIEWLQSRNWTEAFFFAMAVAVGLTPEMLPMIVSVCLSKGAIAMSRKKVIVKRLNSIQNLGAMDVLCTDKTGTLTQDHVILERHCDVVRHEDDGVLDMAFLNSYFQTGLKNVLDRAVLEHLGSQRALDLVATTKIDEIPFDFVRRLMSVVVRLPNGKLRLIAKGAPEAIFERCTLFELDNELLPMDQLLIDDLREEYQNLSSDGFRVLAIAYKDVDPKAAYNKDDERDLVLKGYIAFLDPPKETSAQAIQALNRNGVAVKVITGDNELVTRKICSQVGIPIEHMLLGSQVEPMTEEQLAEAAEKVTVFARMSPGHKQRIIRALQAKKHVVGFMGDGINDAPALRAADVGISVDTAVDIAKESADAILLEKSLLVLEEGVLEGRKVFANILKYVRMGASSNFGNMFSVIGASIWLPFLPMAAIQILTNNLLYDFSQVPIPADDVDADQIAKPRPWSMNELTRFIVFIGPLSSIFDYTTYFMMWFIFKCRDVALHCPPALVDTFTSLAGKYDLADADAAYRAGLFQTGWFVESLMTQTLIIHIIRTNRTPFIDSRASWPLMVTSALIMTVGMLLPISPLGPWLGFAPLPWQYWPLLIVTLLCYCTLTHTVKKWLLRRQWI